LRETAPNGLVSDLGVLATRAVSVPIYATNSKEEAEYIINDAEVKVIFVGDQEQYDKAESIIKTINICSLLLPCRTISNFRRQKRLFE
jgi:long-chain acyl-CoA synthetase